MAPRAPRQTTFQWERGEWNYPETAWTQADFLKMVMKPKGARRTHEEIPG